MQYTTATDLLHTCITTMQHTVYTAKQHTATAKSRGYGNLNQEQK